MLSWLLFVVGDLGVVGWGTWRAWRDGEGGPFSFFSGWFAGLANGVVAHGLDRSELPFFGGLASSFVDSE